MLDAHSWFVVGMGIGTVFLGLICIIILCKVIGLLCTPKNNTQDTPPVSTSAPSAPPIENRQETIAAVCAAAAEELGTDISALRVLSFKRI